MTKRVVIALAAIGILFLLTAFAQRSQIHPTQQLTVHDADGKKVGVVAGGNIAPSPFKPLVAFMIEGIPLMLGVLRDGFTGHTLIGWESLDCTGTAFLFASSNSPISSLPRIGVGPPGNTFYLQDGEIRTVSLLSISEVASIEPGNPLYPCVERQDPWTREAAPARALIEMTTHYRPPFTVR